MRKITVLEQQTVFDLALQELGSAEGVFDILSGNSSLYLDSDLTSGYEMLIDPAAINTSLVSAYANGSIKPGNGLAYTIQVLGTPDGRAIKTNTGKFIKIKIKK